jgi:hypothetical protein
MYIEPADFARIVDHLDDDPEIAWIVGDGGRWVAKPRLDRVPPSMVCLWHIPSGPLPLFVRIPFARIPGGADPVEQKGVIEDPYAGWEDPMGGEFEEPHFGDPPGVVSLILQVKGGPGDRPDHAIGISTFGWIGRHYSALGRVPVPSTTRWWQALRKWVKATAVRVPYSGPLDGPKPEVFAFPAALEAIRSGAPRAASP